MSTALDDVRVEVAFSSDPTTTPAFHDLTSRARLDLGISITRGRTDEFDVVNPGQCTLTFDNTNGDFTPDLAASAFYPNVKPQNRLRVTYREPVVITNLLDAESASFEGGTVGDWVGAGTSAPNVTNTTNGTRFDTHAMHVDWASGGGTNARCQIDVATTVGVTYTGSIYLDVHTDNGHPPFLTETTTGTVGASAITGRITVTWTATATTSTVALEVPATAIVGASTYVDGAQVEVGSTATTFTTATTGIGNMLTANQASMETDSSDWGSNTLFGSADAATSIASSTTRAHSGTKSTLVTWPTTAIGSNAGTWVHTVLGRTYTASAYVYVPTGSPDVKLEAAFLADGTPTSTKDAWDRITVTWTSTTNADVFLCVKCDTATSGDQAWFDDVMVDEGSTAYPFTTTAPPITYRFDGYVEEWPVEWPGGGQTQALSTVTAYDLQSRLSRTRPLGSVIAETYRATGVLWHFPLDEGDGSTSVGDIVGTGVTLTEKQNGSGGTITFGSGTGPGTDGAAAAEFAPASVANGLYLHGTGLPSAFVASSIALTACVLTPSGTVVDQVAARMADAYGTYAELSMNATGHAVATFFDTWSAATATVTSSTTINDGHTHTLAVNVVATSGTMTIELFLDGSSEGTDTATWGAWAFIPQFSALDIGGVLGGRCWTGTLSHVAGFTDSLSTTEAADANTSATDGFAGESAGARITRIATWAGVPASWLAVDAGTSTIAHVDCTGLSPWEYMQTVATSEAGLLFVSADGLVTFYGRSHSYDTTVTATVTATGEDLDPDTRIRSSLQDVYNDVTVTRASGASARAMDATSIAAYGTFGTSIDLVTDTDTDTVDRANWVVATSSTPRTRLPQLNLDGLTSAIASDVRVLDLDARIALSSLPSQAPSSITDLRVEGYTEVIGRGGWSLSCNTVPYLEAPPLILDDATYGLLDSGNRIVY